MSRVTETNRVAIQEISFTNIDKVLWPEDGYTKWDLIQYYILVSPYMLPHLHLRPLVLTRYPDGIDGEWFYQKNAPEYTPNWIKTFRYQHKDGPIDYILAETPETLAWL
ncbi:MAG TPA: DNA polymerase domain-containing protein, partial [Clostridia bacterium]|nr:DNA polymerase domain-containing protein [Clostridia bacterium]